MNERDVDESQIERQIDQKESDKQSKMKERTRVLDGACKLTPLDGFRVRDQKLQFPVLPISAIPTGNYKEVVIRTK